jgi:hypothetical protein
MGFYTRDFTLLPGERLIWRAACNWRQGPVARGGHLALTSQALVFQPHRFDAQTGGQPRRIPLDHVAAVSIEPGGIPKGLLAGGLRRRLRLDLIDGSTELLLMNRVAQRLAQVQAAVAKAR